MSSRTNYHPMYEQLMSSSITYKCTKQQKKAIKFYQKISFKHETLKGILSSPEYLYWINIELFKPIHDVLKDPFIKINYFKIDVLLKLIDALKYLERKKVKKVNNEARINELQNVLLRVIKSLGFTMNIKITVQRFPLENDFDEARSSIVILLRGFISG
ncbi:2338_t:CDS:2 [Funneliformis mosseae]|uniref:2338_t:CDS:1 n=1 Tax=Funneliformis mosseae TaxID=27381 RepID=A0A9N8YQ63_FUNMO|nr:2338_t:CDS:2 [Funneliformis mosseae]